MIETLKPARCDFLGYTPEGEKNSAESRREGGLWKHSSAAEIVSRLPQGRENLTVYLISLRPWWQRVGSFYFHAKRHNEMRGAYKWVVGMSVSEFLRSKHVEEVERLDQFCENDSVDYFVEFSQIDEWYSSILAELGRPGQVLPKYNIGNPAGETDYRQLFSNADMELLSARFAGETAMLDKIRAGNREKIWHPPGGN
ncbi:hypothetical protein FGG78_08405 [Thioclava sp. BHET1]|nr:hypothetical protein FGG78_08405 [Thioclava sp. BHET1]